MPAGELVTVPVPVPLLATLRASLGIAANSAPTDFAALIVTLHSFDPTIESQPLQTTALEPGSATALRVTALPASNSASQVPPQLIPAGELVTVPVPLPLLVTLSRWDSSAKAAVTSLAALIVTLHSFDPTIESQPLQTTALVLGPAAPTRITSVPSVKAASQVAPQLMPAGELVTVPVPVPLLATLRASLGIAAKSAPTDFAALIVTLHSFDPTIESQPLQTTALVFGPAAPTR